MCKGKWLLEKNNHKCYGEEQSLTTKQHRQKAAMSLPLHKRETASKRFLNIPPLPHLLLLSSLSGRLAMSVMSFSISKPPSFACYLSPSL